MLERGQTLLHFRFEHQIVITPNTKNRFKVLLSEPLIHVVEIPFVRFEQTEHVATMNQHIAT